MFERVDTYENGENVVICLSINNKWVHRQISWETAADVNKVMNLLAEMKQQIVEFKSFDFPTIDQIFGTKDTSSRVHLYSL